MEGSHVPDDRRERRQVAEAKLLSHADGHPQLVGQLARRPGDDVVGAGLRQIDRGLEKNPRIGSGEGFMEGIRFPDCRCLEQHAAGARRHLEGQVDRRQSRSKHREAGSIVDQSLDDRNAQRQIEPCPLLGVECQPKGAMGVAQFGIGHLTDIDLFHPQSLVERGVRPADGHRLVCVRGHHCTDHHKQPHRETASYDSHGSPPR